MMGNSHFIPGKPPSKEELRLKSPEERGLIREDISFRIITPVFGGGVRTEDNQHPIDRVTPVRTPSIRGQLRFWWRALAECSSIEELRTKEDELWGNASKPGEVLTTLLSEPSRPKTKEVFEKGAKPIDQEDARKLAYGAFPLQGTSSNQKPGMLSFFPDRESFVLRVEFPEDSRQEVEATLLAWLNFGGIGGRTRRGFGAVAPVDAKWRKNPEDLLKEFKNRGPSFPGITSFREARFSVAHGFFESGIKALGFALEKLKDFRQKPGFARNRGNGPRPGRSRWPEADTIRHLTKQYVPKHSERITHVDKFPRGAFGMPIIFHFKDHGDPLDQTLKPKEKERRASPLFLRPFLATDGKFQTLALIMNDPAIRNEHVQLNNHPVEINLTQEEAKRIEPLDGNPDVLGRFLEYFQSGS